MKTKLLFTAVCAFTFCGLNAQILFVPSGTNGIGTSTNQNVGIGISTPTAKLDIIKSPTIGGLNINTTTESVPVIGGGSSTETTPFALKVQYQQSLYVPATNETVALIDGLGKTTLGNLAGISLSVTDYLNVKNGFTLFRDNNNFVSLRSESTGANFTWKSNSTNRDLNFNYSGVGSPLATLNQYGTFTLHAAVAEPNSGNVNGLEINNDGDQNDDYALRINTEVGTIFRVANNGRMFLGENLNSGADIEEYRLFVETGIRTEKIRVDIATDNGWADFVFDEDYKLMPIEELHAFIKTNKHLPNVPSAAQVAEEGIDLAEMNAILLRQIEELTLRTLELEKRLSKMEKTKL